MANRRIRQSTLVLGLLLIGICLQAGGPALACDSGSEQPAAKTKSKPR